MVLSILGKKCIHVIGQIDEILHSSKFAINIHVSVQNTDDLDLAAVFLPVKNHMAAGAHFSVAFPNIAAIFSQKGIGGQLLKATVKHGQVTHTPNVLECKCRFPPNR